MNISSSLFVKEGQLEALKLNYVILSNLGEGSFGKVKLVKYLPTDELRAMKMILKAPYQDSGNEEMLEREIEILKNLKHQHILQIFEYYKDNIYFYIITEYCEGGELFEKITKMGCLPERLAAEIMRQVFSAIDYVHKNHIVHRDLKPDNILLEDREDSSIFLKIIDFGTSRPFKKNSYLSEKTGTV